MSTTRFLVPLGPMRWTFAHRPHWLDLAGERTKVVLPPSVFFSQIPTAVASRPPTGAGRARALGFGSNAPLRRRSRMASAPPGVVSASVRRLANALSKSEGWLTGTCALEERVHVGDFLAVTITV